MIKNKKSQAFTSDFVISISVFLIVLILITYMWDHTIYQILRIERVYDMDWVAKTALEQLIRSPGMPLDWYNHPNKIIVFGLVEHNPMKIISKPSINQTYFIQDRLIDADKLFYFISFSRNNYALSRRKFLRLGKYHYYVEMKCVNESNIKNCFSGQFFDSIKEGYVNCSNDNYLYIKNKRFVYADYPKSIISLWLFDEDGGGIVYDTFEKNNGRINGSKWVDGFLGSALYFDGDDYVECGKNKTINPTENITIEVWVNPSKKKEGYIVAKWGEEKSYYLKIRNDGHIEAGFSSDGTNINSITVSNNPINLDRWTHIVYTKNMNSHQIYINGNPSTKINFPSAGIFFSENTSLTIGGDSTSTPKYFNGSIDHVAIYNDTLSDTEVKKLYDEESKLIDNCTFGFYPEGEDESHIIEKINHESTVTLSKPLDIEDISGGKVIILKPTIKIMLVVWESDRKNLNIPTAGSGGKIIPY